MAAAPRLVDLAALYAPRWNFWRPRLRPELVQDPRIELGLPVFLGAQESLLRDGHRQIGRADAGRLVAAARGATQAYCLGYPVQVRGLGTATAPIHLRPGEGGGAEAVDASGRCWPVQLRVDYHGVELDAAGFFARFPEPPLLLTRTRFPVQDSVSLFELLPYRGAAAAAFGQDWAHLDLGSQEMARDQGPYLRWLLDLFGGAADKVCVDLGCGTGWLAGALCEQGVAGVLGLDLRRGSLANFDCSFTNSSTSLLAVGDMFDWPLRADTVDLILLRNNSGLVFAPEFGPPIRKLFADLATSLRPGGGVYLSYLSSGSGAAQGAFNNHSLLALSEALEGSGLQIAKLMRAGEISGALLCATGDEIPQLAAADRRQRLASLQAYCAAGRSAAAQGRPIERARQRCWALCLFDLASEVMRRAIRARSKRVKLSGPRWLRNQLGWVLRRWAPELAALPRGELLRVALAAGPAPDRESNEDAALWRPFASCGTASHDTTSCDTADATPAWDHHLLGGDFDARALELLEDRLSLAQRWSIAQPFRAPGALLRLKSRWQQVLERA